jgi:RimJ/RimL family protein N-acetyltransferase
MNENLQFPFEESLYFPLEKGGLRALEMEDEHALIAIALREPDLFRFTLHSMKTEQEIRTYFRFAHSQRKHKLEYPFTIVHPETAEIIGTTRFYLIQPSQGSIAIGYTWMTANYHNKGLNRHIKQVMLKFVFETLAFHRVEFRTDAENSKTIRSLLNLGAISEGELRSHIFRPDGSRRNTRICSILSEEYPLLSFH